MAQALAEKIKQAKPAEKERVVSVPQKSSWQGSQVRIFQTKKNRTIIPDHQIVKWKKVKVSESRTLAGKKEFRAVSWRGKSQLHPEGRRVLKWRSRASKGNLSRRRSKKHERVS